MSEIPTPSTRRRRAGLSAEPSASIQADMPQRRSARLSSRQPTTERTPEPLPVIGSLNSAIPGVLSVPDPVKRKSPRKAAAATTSTLGLSFDSAAAQSRRPTSSGLSSRVKVQVPSRSQPEAATSSHQEAEPRRRSRRSEEDRTHRDSFGRKRKTSETTATEFNAADDERRTRLRSRSRSKSQSRREASQPYVRLPRWAHLSCVIITSLVLNAALPPLLIRLGIKFTQLAEASEQPSELSAVLVLLLWRITELTTGWALGLDDFDFASLSLLTHLPHLLFLHTFYMLPATEVASLLVTDIISSTLPFALVQPRSSAHSFPDRRVAAKTAPSFQTAVLADPSTSALTIVLPALLYAISLVSAYRLPSLLPLLVSTFSLDSVEMAHEFAASPTFGPRSLPALAATLLPLGFAARAFLFSPAASMTKEDRQGRWGRGAVLVGRTVVVIALGMGNAIFRTGGTVRGGHVKGALAWGGIWGIATSLVSVMYWWIGHV